MHNTPLENAEFKLTWNENNYRWLLGESPRDEIKLARCLKWIKETKEEIAKLKAEGDSQ